MRILYFTERDSPHDQRFLRALAGTSHQVFALRQVPEKAETPAGIISVAWPAGQADWSHWPGWMDGKQQLSVILKEINPDLVHAGPVQGPALLTALVGFHPLVTMSWGSDLLYHAQRSPWKRLATTYTLARTDVFFGDCQTVAHAAIRYGMAPENIMLFPWGVDLNHFSPENDQRTIDNLRSELGWEDKFVILCNRSWAPIYGVDVLAKAFVRAVETDNRLRLLLVGDGPEAGYIQQILEPVKHLVHYPGRLPNESLPGMYRTADLFVSPSHCDGSSISLLEAMACGCPVLVSDIPSNLEWVKPQVVGDIFMDGDVDHLQDKLLTMAADPNLYRYGQQARKLAEKRANWKENFQKLLAGYDLAINQDHI
jgi:glycosyltransferase involved in cell wall biosynthesis